MANLKDIRRRIRSARNIQQITRAMKFVSAARLRRAQDRAIAARPYAKQITEVLKSLVGRVPADAHPLLMHSENVENIELVVITSDRGMCGAYNTNIIRGAIEFLGRNTDKKVELNILGKRARDFFRRRPYPVRGEAVDVLQNLTFADAAAIAKTLIDDFCERKTDEVWLIYNEFKSVVQQRVVCERLLPIEHMENQDGGETLEYIYDEPPEKIFAGLLPRYVEAQVFRVLLESAASEHGARMTAMEAATNNAADMIDALTLHANKIRQAGITRELIEVVSGTGQ